MGRQRLEEGLKLEYCPYWTFISAFSPTAEPLAIVKEAGLFIQFIQIRVV
jgi:hypothetical protein